MIGFVFRSVVAVCLPFTTIEFIPFGPQEKIDCLFYADWNETYRNTLLAMFATFFMSMTGQNISDYLAQYLIWKSVLFDAYRNGQLSAS
ncbi:hypothetical protein N7523_000545 [Penicillium sp. IBT 18751x]|nr:hypothetical protein N7523_000545 [Penicillium sp. IBT 18751x]